jgi:hypothetical protein
MKAIKQMKKRWMKEGRLVGRCIKGHKNATPNVAIDNDVKLSRSRQFYQHFTSSIVAKFFSSKKLKQINTVNTY